MRLRLHFCRGCDKIIRKIRRINQVTKALDKCLRFCCTVYIKGKPGETVGAKATGPPRWGGVQLRVSARMPIYWKSCGVVPGHNSFLAAQEKISPKLKEGGMRGFSGAESKRFSEKANCPKGRDAKTRGLRPQGGYASPSARISTSSFKEEK